MSNSPLIPIGVIALVVCLLYSLGGARDAARGEYTRLPVTDNPLSGARYHGNRPDAEITLTPPAGGGAPLRLAVFDGMLFEPNEQRDERAKRAAASPAPGTSGPAAKPAGTADTGDWHIEYRVNRYALDYSYDLGAWVGFRVKTTSGDNPKGDVGLDAGLRFSPVRLGYGIVSPDLLVSPRQAGVGVSFYPPAATVAPALQHFGVGVGYLADYRGGAGWSPYFSLSTRF